MIILHDFFTQKGGGENLIISISNKYNAKIFTLLNTSYPNFQNIHEIAPKFFTKFNKFLFLLYSLFMSIKSNDAIIFSGNYVIFSIWRCVSPSKIVYHHSLPKTIFADNYISFKSTILKKLLKIPLKKLIEFNLSKADIIYFNSNKSKNKFLKQINLNNPKTVYKVLYPYSDISFTIKPHKPKDYIVINSRHTEEKNILSVLDLIKDRPDIKCYVTNFGVMTKALQVKFQNYNNIYLCGYLTDDKYKEMIQGAISILFPSFDEDFGIGAMDAYNLNVPLLIYKNAGFSEILGSNYKLYLDKNDLFKLIKNITDKNQSDYYKNRKDYKMEFFKEFDNYN